jgi:hypothetical protein
MTAGSGLGSGGGGNLTLTSGASATGRAGDVQIVGGIGSTDDGEVNMTTGPNGVVSIRTSTTFTSTQVEHLTFGAQTVAPQDAIATDVVVLGTLATNGRNMQFVVYITATDNASASNFISTYIVQSAYRASGVVNLVTAHDTSKQGNGAPFLSDLTFSLVVSGNNIVLSVLNTNSTTDYTLNLAIHWRRQQGGFTS